MGHVVSQDQTIITENRQTKNNTQDIDKCSDINFTSEIKRPSPSIKHRQLPDDISKMDEDEAYDTVCSEIDQALAGHYAFLQSNPTEQKRPTLQLVEKMLDEQGFKNPDLTDATQRDLVKSYLQKKKPISPQPPALPDDDEIDALWEQTLQQQTDWSRIGLSDQAKTPETPPVCKLPKKFQGKRVPIKKPQNKQINEVLLQNRAFIKQDQSTNVQPKGKSSKPKLDSIPQNMPSLDPIGLDGNRWVRPDSLVAEEAKASKKYKKTLSSEALSSNRMQENDRGYQPQVASQEFDASKFAEANVKTRKDLNIYSETTYRKYKKSASHHDKQDSQDSMKRPQVSIGDLDVGYDSSMEALLLEIENEFK